MALMARQMIQDLNLLGSNPPAEARKIEKLYFLFWVGCFGIFICHIATYK